MLEKPNETQSPKMFHHYHLVMVQYSKIYSFYNFTHAAGPKVDPKVITKSNNRINIANSFSGVIFLETIETARFKDPIIKEPITNRY